MYGYLPSNFSFHPDKAFDKYLYLSTSLYLGKIYEKRHNINSFIPLNAKLLISVLGGRYLEFIKTLVNKNIIETDNHYINGSKSKGYRFTKEFRYSKHQRMEFIDSRIVNKIKTAKGLQLRGIIYPQHKYLLDSLVNVSINYKEANLYIENNIFNLPSFNSYSIAVDLIHQKDFFFVVDKTAGRVHNNITNLPSELRQFLSYNGESLVEIDIANSQPFLLTSLIPSYFNSNSSIISNLYLSYGHQYPISYTDLKLYSHLTSSGKFYEFLMPYFPKVSRDDFKVKVFGRIFYNDNTKYEYKEWKVFQSLFPTVSKIISYHKKDNYKNLAITLQKVEADLIINRVVPKLMGQKIFVLTIHDSLLTTSQNIEIVSNTLLREIQNTTGLTPTLKIKNGKVI